MFDWWKQLHFGIKAGTALFALIGASGAAAKTWIDFNLFVPASRQWVSAEIDTTKTTVQDVQIEIAEGKREQTKDSLAKWGVELARAANDQTKSLIQRQINELQATIDRLNSQITTLKQLRGR